MVRSKAARASRDDETQQEQAVTPAMRKLIDTVIGPALLDRLLNEDEDTERARA
jgi:hypothetical protein